jgi:hypothetical protein
VTIYNSAKASATPKYLDNAAGVNVLANYTFGTTSLPTLQNGDTFVLMTMPQGCSVFDLAVDVDKLDGGGSPSILFSVGDAANPARYISGATIARTGGNLTPNVTGWLGYTPTANAPIIVTITATANGAVPANAGFRAFISYTADP